MKPEPEKIAKLPKWAQEYISDLELYLGQLRFGKWAGVSNGSR